MTAPKETEINLNFAQFDYQIMGRSRLQQGTLAFSYPGVSISFNVLAQNASITASSSTGNSYIDIFIDDQLSQTVRLSQQPQIVSLFESPQQKQHAVRVVNRSETWHGINQLSQLTLYGGNTLPSTPLASKKLLILGDSVTCAEAIDRVPNEQKNPAWWNPSESYGMLAAAELDAQVHLVCHGGRGLVRSWNNRTDEQNLIDFTPLIFAYPGAPNWDPQQYQPDLIISAIGTNDFNPGVPDKNEYVSAYLALLKQLHQDYPTAQIALMEGSILNGENKHIMQQYIEQTIEQTTVPNTVQFSSPYYPGDTQDGHPTKAQHALMATHLAEQIKTLMKW